MINEKSQWRQAALLLHAMHPHDRDWMLGQLDRDEQSLLAGLLEELRALGMPADRDMVIRATRLFDNDAALPDQTAEAESESKDMSGASLAVLINQLRQASPRAVASALRYEPVSLTASLLSIEAWPWQDALLSHLGVVKRRQVEDLLAVRSKCPDRLAQLLLTLLLPRIAQFRSANTIAPAGANTKPELVPKGMIASWRRVLARLMQARQPDYPEYSGRRDRGL